MAPSKKTKKDKIDTDFEKKMEEIDKPSKSKKNESENKSRANSISSLSTLISKQQSETKKTISSVTKSIGSIAKDQKETAKILKVREIGYSKGIKDIEKSMKVILTKLGYTIDEVGRGAKKIAIQTAITTKDTVKQWGRAVGEDVNINKQNMLAMMLSRSTPIFGYFAAKFMETDVFQKAKEKMKESLSNAFSIVGQRIKGWFQQGKEKAKFKWEEFKDKRREAKEAKKAKIQIIKEEKPKETSKKVKSVLPKIKEKPKIKVPALQTGGIIQKEGLVKIHAAEVVSPIDKFYKNFESSLKPLSESFDAMQTNMTKEIRRLRFALVGLGKEMSSQLMEQLTTNPTFRTIFTGFNVLKNSIISPLKFLFRPRGGYFSHIPRGGNVFANMATILGLIYSATQPKLDTIIQLLQSIAKVITKKDEVAEVKSERWTMFDRMKDFFKGENREKWKEQTLKDITGKLLLDKDSLTRSGLYGKAENFMGLSGKEKIEKVKESTSKDNLIKIKNDIVDGLKIGISENNKESLDKFDTLINKTEKGFKSVEGGVTKTLPKKMNNIMEDTTKRLDKTLKKLKGGFDHFMLLFMGVVSFIKSMFGKLFGVFSKIPLLGKLFGTRGVAGAAAGAGKGLGGKLKGIGSSWSKRAGGVGKAMIGGAGGILGGAMMGMDAVEGYEKATDWFGKDASTSEKVSAAIGGALGGTKGGVEGALSGVAKGAGIGMMVGSIFPGIGTAIGGAVGAIAGGILGFVGGENIAKGLSYIWDNVTKLVESIKKMVMLPIDFMMESASKIKTTLSETFTSVWDSMKNGMDNVTEMISSIFEKVREMITSPFKFVKGLIFGTDKTIQEKAEAAKTTTTSAGIPIPAYEEGSASVPETGLALVHEGEAIIPANIAEKARKTLLIPKDIQEGAVAPDPEVLEDIISETMEASAKSKEGGIMGSVKGLFEKASGFFKGMMGPSSGFGWLARMFESGGAGPAAVSSGYGDFGGKSYGSYQFASRTGDVDRFLKGSGYDKMFAGLSVGSGPFDEKWKNLGMNDPKFAEAQNEYIKAKYLYPQAQKILSDTGIDVRSRHPIISEETLSTAVQYGPATSVISRALRGTDPASITDAEILQRIGQQKIENVGTNFRSSSPAVQASVANRIKREISLALGQLPATESAKVIQSLPKAQTGGFIEKTGPIVAHAGEIIGPLESIKDVVEKALMNRKDIAEKQVGKEMLPTEIMAKTNKEFQDSALTTLKEGQGQQISIVTALSNNLSSSMNQVANNTANMAANSGKSGSLNDLVHCDYQ